MDEQDSEPGLHPIGSLLPKTASSPLDSDSTPTSSGMIASTSGGRSLTALKLVSSTGRQLIETDAVNLLADKVRRGDPNETNATLEVLLKPYVSLSWQGIPTDDPYTTYAKQRLIIDRHYDTDDRPYIRNLVKASMLPAQRTEIIKALGRLRLLTIWRAGTTEEGAMIFAAFADDLAEWPADAVLSALREWPKVHRYWPALTELLDEVRTLCHVRLKLWEIFR